jgi:hypothetical protein
LIMAGVALVGGGTSVQTAHRGGELAP